MTADTPRDFQKKAPDLQRVEDETNNIALAESPTAPPAAHAGAAANAVADAEAGADIRAPSGGIDPIIDTPPPSDKK